MANAILFEPLQLGALSLPNRIIMPALTRMRAGPGGVPTAPAGRISTAPPSAARRSAPAATRSAAKTVAAVLPSGSSEAATSLAPAKCTTVSTPMDASWARSGSRRVARLMWEIPK